MPPRYTRREALQLGSLGLVSGYAGCMGYPNNERGSQTPTSSNQTTQTSQTADSENYSIGETATSSNGVSVTISNSQVRKIISTPDVGSPAHTQPIGNTESQFLGINVSTQAKEISTLRLTPVINGTRREVEAYRHSVRPGSSGRLSFQVPIIQTNSGVIEWQPSSDEKYQWELPDSTLAAIGSSPQFDVQQFSTPNTINNGSSFTASITITNTGDRSGRYLAIVLDEGASSIPLISEFTIPVSASKTVTRDLSGRDIRTEQSSITAILDWGIDKKRTTVSITE